MGEWLCIERVVLPSGTVKEVLISGRVLQQREHSTGVWTDIPRFCIKWHFYQCC